MAERFKIPQSEYTKIRAETDQAIQKGYDHAKAEWRMLALEVLYDTCLQRETFTVNDFRDQLRSLDVQTHDNRAVGGLMVAGRRYGWIQATDDKSGSLVAHFVPVRVWKSLIYPRRFQAVPAPELEGQRRLL